MAKKSKVKIQKPEACTCRSWGSGLLIPAGLFIGFSLGFIFGNLPAGISGGLGAGFLAFAILKLTCC